MHPKVSDKFYRVVVQAVLLFGVDIWVLTETIMQRLEGANVSLQQQFTHKQVERWRDGSWWQVTSEKKQGAGTKTLRTYVDRKQAKLAEWVDTRPIFDVCTRETEYELGVRLQVPWWRQKAAEDQLRVMVEAILAAARVRRWQESGGHGGRKGELEGVIKYGKGWGEAGCMGMLGQIQVTPMWEDYPVRRHVSVGGVGAGWGCPPPKYIKREQCESSKKST